MKSPFDTLEEELGAVDRNKAGRLVIRKQFRRPRRGTPPQARNKHAEKNAKLSHCRGLISEFAKSLHANPFI